MTTFLLVEINCDHATGIPPKPWPVVTDGFTIKLDGYERVETGGVPKVLTSDEAKDVLRKLGHDKG